MTRTTTFDAATDILKIGVLSSIQSAGKLAQVGVKRHVLNVVFLQVASIVRLQGQAMDARRVKAMETSEIRK